MSAFLNSNEDTQKGGGADLISESSTQQFVADVIERSNETPILVDFWAEWCEPCKQLTPIMEKLVREYGGAVRLVKVNVDENQDLAQQLRVQSIPVVYAFKAGRPVDAFTGAQTESQVRAFIDRLTGGAGSPVDQVLDQAKSALDAGDPATAGALYSELLAAEPENVAAAAGLARCYLAEGNADRARQILDDLPEAAQSVAEVAAVRTALDLASASRETGASAELAGSVAENPDDHAARFDLAQALYGEARTEEAIDELVEIVRRNQSWNEEAARHQLLKIFEALGHADPITVEGRRKLSAVLFS